MKRRFACCTVTVLLMLMLCVELCVADPSVAVEWSEYIDIHPGVRYRKGTQTDGKGNQALNLLVIERNVAPVSIEASLANGEIDGIATVRQQAYAFIEEGKQVIAAFNGDYAVISGIGTGMPIGLHVQDGELISSPQTWPSFGISEMGDPLIGQAYHETRIEFLNDDGSIAFSINANHLNKTRDGSALVVYTPRWGRRTPADDRGLELIVRGIEGPFYPNAVYEGVIADRRFMEEGAEIPEDGIVISAGMGAAVVHLRKDYAAPGKRVRISCTLNEPWSTARHAVSGSTVIVEDGQVNRWMDLSLQMFKIRNPRTVIGYNEDYIFILTIDGRQPGYADGMTLIEAAEIMVDLGAERAINMDGGGSTTFLLRMPGDSDLTLMNSPSDGNERRLANGIMVISKLEE